MWPVAHARHKAMLDRIEMNVIDMPREIAVIANGVLPRSAVAIAQGCHSGLRLNAAPAAINCVLKCPLILRHLPEKSASSGGSVITTCKWSGRMTIPSTVNGRSLQSHAKGSTQRRDVLEEK